MKQHKKVTYTLDREVINTIKRMSFLEDTSKSQFVSNCIQSGYEMMVDGYYDNDKQPLAGVIRKQPNTIPATFTLPMDVIDTLNWFSDQLEVKRSHLVRSCVRKAQIESSEKLSQQVGELMKSG